MIEGNFNEHGLNVAIRYGGKTCEESSMAIVDGEVRFTIAPGLEAAEESMNLIELAMKLIDKSGAAPEAAASFLMIVLGKAGMLSGVDPAEIVVDEDDDEDEED